MTYIEYLYVGSDTDDFTYYCSTYYIYFLCVLFSLTPMSLFSPFRCLFQCPVEALPAKAQHPQEDLVVSKKMLLYI